MRAFSLLAGAGCLLLVACADASDPAGPAGPAFALAGDLVVNALDDVVDADGCTAAHCSLREAIEGAAGGETITFAVTGTLQLAAFPLFLDVPLTIIGPGAADLTIVATPFGFGNIFHILPDITAAISGLRLTGGAATFGGAVRNGGTLSLDAMVIEGNAARQGGGILNTGTLAVRNSLLHDNVAYDEDTPGNAGGGIFSDGMLIVENTRLEGNRAEGSASGLGGAIYNRGTLELRDSRLAGNAAIGGSFGLGGGLHNDGAGAHALVERTAFLDNRAAAAGGSARGAGLASRSALLVLRDSEIAGNVAAGVFAFGGGIDIENGTAEIANAIVRANGAHAQGVFGNGGGLFAANADATVRHIALYGNETSHTGDFRAGALAGFGGTVRVLNSVATGNVTTANVFDLSILLAAPNDVRGNVLGSVPPPAGVPDASNLLLPVAPADVPATLGIAPGGGTGHVTAYLVLPGSVLVDQGVADGCVPADLLGTARPQGAACDAGAIEYAGGDFVTGAGWIDSPAGAWSGDPALAGRATFAFNGRPPKPGRQPRGFLEFVLPDGFRLHSTAIRTLAVSSPLALIEGDALLDGVTPVTFAVTATDGSPGAMRLSIADPATGDVLYDSGARTPGAGSIIVHAK